jgi:hypothetical protein
VSGPEVLPPGSSIARVRVRAHDRAVSTPECNGTPRYGCLKASIENVPDGTKNGGESGIRTHGAGISSTHDFQSCSFGQLGHLSADRPLCEPRAAAATWDRTEATTPPRREPCRGAIWRRGWDLNPRSRFWQDTAFRERRLQPLGHLSGTPRDQATIVFCIIKTLACQSPFHGSSICRTSAEYSPSSRKTMSGGAMVSPGRPPARPSTSTRRASVDPEE